MSSIGIDIDIAAEPPRGLGPNLRKDLLAWYTLDGHLLDVHGGHHITVNTGTFVAGDQGPGLYFDAEADQYASVPEPDWSDLIGSPYTIAYTVRMDSITFERTILKWGDGTTRLLHRTGSSNHVDHRQAGTSYGAKFSPVLAHETIHRVVVTLGADGVLRAWAHGEAVTPNIEVPGAPFWTTLPPGDLYLGAANASGDNGAEGWIDNVAVWSRELVASERARYMAGMTYPAPATGGDSGPPLAPSAFPGASVFLNYGDPAVLFEDTARTDPVDADEDLIKGVADGISTNHGSQAADADAALYKVIDPGVWSYAHLEADHYDIPSIALTGGWYVAFVGQLNGFGSIHAIAGQADDSTYIRQISATQFTAKGDDATERTAAAGTALATGEVFICEYVCAVDGTVSLYQDGVLMQQATGVDTSMTLDRLFGDGTYAATLEGGAILVADGEPTDEERMALRQYLRATWDDVIIL